MGSQGMMESRERSQAAASRARAQAMAAREAARGAATGGLRGEKKRPTFSWPSSGTQRKSRGPGAALLFFLIPRESELDSEGIKFDSEGIYYLTEGGERGVIDENEARCEGSGFTA